MKRLLGCIGILASVLILANAAFAEITVSAVETGQIVIDGQLDDWSETEAIRADARENAVYKASNWEGPDDLRFTYRFATDGRALYAAVQVWDDVFVPPDAESGLLQADHIEFWFDTIPQKARETFENEFEDDRVETVREQSGLVQIAFGYGQEPRYFFPENPPFVAPIEFAFDQSTSGYALEVMFQPRDFIQLPAPVIKNLGFLVDVIDADNPDNPGQDMLFSSSPNRKYGDPDTFGLLTLDELLLTESLINQIEAKASARALPCCYPHGFWEADSGGWQYLVTALRPVLDQPEIFFEFTEFYPQFAGQYELPGQIPMKLNVCTFDDNLTFCLPTADTLGQASVRGYWFNEQTAQDFEHYFTEAYELQTFTYPDSQPGFTVSRMYFSPTGRGICGAAEAYATEFYRVENGIHHVLTIESFPCMENDIYKTWTWQKAGQEIHVYQHEDMVSDPANMVSEQIQIYVWDGSEFVME